jgi:hypothetical protein
MLGWHTRPLIATSAWQLAAGDSQQWLNSAELELPNQWKLNSAELELPNQWKLNSGNPCEFSRVKWLRVRVRSLHSRGLRVKTQPKCVIVVFFLNPSVKFFFFLFNLLWKAFSM